MRKGVFLVALILMVGISYTTEAKQKIGVFDSRLVAIYSFRSESFMKEMKDMQGDFKKAKDKKDTVTMRKLEQKGQLKQKIAHDKGFGRGSVAEMIEKHAAELKAFAVKNGLSAIVSKWELLYSNDDFELVDITLPILKEIFKAPEDVLKMYDEMKKAKPIENAFFLED